MTFTEWGVIIAACMLFIAVIGIVVRNVDRLNKAEAAAKAASTRADDASVAAAALRLEMERLENDLTDHRVATAEKYVSKETLASLENRIVDAIRSLGDRIDNMFNNHGNGRSPK